MSKSFIPPNYKTEDYRPADLTVFAGRGYKSRTIALATCTWSQIFRCQLISHIGIVSRHKEEPKHFESTTWRLQKCEIQERYVKGVQANDPELRVAMYPGHVWLLRLSDRHQLTLDQQQRLEYFCHYYLGTPYDYTQAMLSGTKFIKNLSCFRADKRLLFCDEFVGFGLMDCKVIGHGDFIPSSVTPGWLVWWLVAHGIYQPLKRLK